MEGVGGGAEGVVVVVVVVVVAAAAAVVVVVAVVVLVLLLLLPAFPSAVAVLSTRPEYPRGACSASAWWQQAWFRRTIPWTR